MAWRKENVTPDDVQRTRAWTGLWVVVGGDGAIAVAAIWGVVKVSGSANTNAQMVAILTSAFTAISTMTTAYFGIRATSNTAQASLSAPGGGAPPNTGGGSGGPPPPSKPATPPDGPAGPVETEVKTEPKPHGQ
jgi:hypothetical protein